MFAKLVTQTVGNALGLVVAARIIDGVTLGFNFTAIASAALLLALFNLAISPIIKLIAFPLRVLTFNLFSLVIDMAMLWIADVIIPDLSIIGLAPLFWTTLLIMVINIILWKLLSPSLKSS